MLIKNIFILKRNAKIHFFLKRAKSYSYYNDYQCVTLAINSLPSPYQLPTISYRSRC